MAMGAEAKHYGKLLAFDPEQGETVLSPAGEGSGYWVGAPSVLYDAEAGRFYLYYRVRKPRPVRGGECYIATSRDGLSFETIWGAKKQALDSPSVERSSLLKAGDGSWLLYVSYVDASDGRWRIDCVEANAPGGFCLDERKRVLTADDIGAEGVKDPWVMVVNGLYYMLVSYATSVDVSSEERAKKHATGDIYNTGLTRSSTGLAVSGDGRSFQWLGDIFAPRPGCWDAYAARLGCLVPTGHGWVGFYDGSRSVDENYEERTGLVQTWDLETFYRLSDSGPSIVSPHGSGGLRYVDAVVFDDEYWFYYEYCRPDGSHELRLNRVKR